MLGLKVEFRQLDWARVPAALAADRYDVAISSMATDPRPPGRLAFTVPYAYTTAQVAVRQGDSAITTLGQLRGKTIGVSAATTFQQFLEAAGGVNVALYSSDADALPDVGNATLAGAMTAATTAATEEAAGAQVPRRAPGSSISRRPSPPAEVRPTSWRCSTAPSARCARKVRSRPCRASGITAST